MKLFKIINTLGCLLIIQAYSLAQVQFKLAWQPSEERYLVSMISDATWNAPYNRTSSAQVTIKAPTGQLEITELTSLQPGVSWEANSRINAPGEVADCDYISVAMTSLGTSGLSYQQGTEVPLFQFKTASGCINNIRLIDNETDAFMPPNSRQANVGNQITTLGARGEAFAGITGGNPINCNGENSEEEDAFLYDIYPNPAVRDLFVSIEWENEPEEVTIKFIATDGKEIQLSVASLETGRNEIKLLTDKIAAGVYHLSVQGKDWTRHLDEVLITR